MLVAVTDPPDPLADIARNLAGHDRVLSSGRFRVHLGAHFGVDPRYVEAQVIGGGAIVGTHRFFLGSEHNGDHAKLTFYVIMTVLVSAICVAIIAKGTPSVWELW